MIEALPPVDNAERVAAVQKLHLLDTPIEERFERITRMVCRTLGVPISIFNLLDDERQFYKSVQGLTATNASLEGAFCTHVINGEGMMLVPNAREDIRFHDNPFVTGEFLDIGFYAGCPVRGPDGFKVGTLCAIDREPRDMTDEQLEALRDLAAMVETELRAARLSKAQESLIQELDTANRLALIDPLTRIWNRAGIFELLDREWAEAARVQRPVSIIMADIDHFKSINDTFGHQAGDAVLRAVSKKLMEVLRIEDSIGRIGGEEFFMVLANCPPSELHDSVERIREAIAAEPISIGAQAITVTLSFGATAGIPGPGLEIADLIRQADEALYAAKRAGRNRTEISIHASAAAA